MYQEGRLYFLTNKINRKETHKGSFCIILLQYLHTVSILCFHLIFHLVLCAELASTEFV